MKLYNIAILALSMGFSLSATAQNQNTTIDLSKDPGATNIVNRSSNASLLQQSQKKESQQQPDSLMLHPKGSMEGTYNGRSLMQTSDNPQLMNAQRTQYNIGNTKATSTIYYDETGKVKGNSTTISVGGK